MKRLADLIQQQADSVPENDLPGSPPESASPSPSDKAEEAAPATEVGVGEGNTGQIPSC